MLRPWMKFYPSDWRSEPRLRMCSLAARGLWIEMMSYMHEGEPYGHFLIDGKPPEASEISSLMGRPVKEVTRALDELSGKGVFSVTEAGWIYSRRMVRDRAKEISNVENGSDGGNPEIRRGTVPKHQRSRRYRRSDSPEKTRRIFERDGGKCHWCGCGLVLTIEPGQDIPPNFFHVDHVLAICDGGTNDEDNLVAACAACNHKRARHVNPTASPTSTIHNIPTATMVRVGNASDPNSDPKAHMLEARSQKETRKQDAASAAASAALDFENGHAPPTPEAELFARGKAILGKNSGGLISNLLKAKGGNLALARAALETASTKENPREYIGGTIRGDPDVSEKERLRQTGNAW